MPIVPDTKDWTWVLERACPECGFDSRTLTRDAVAQAIRDNASAWVDLLGSVPEERLRHRRRDDRWSPLEYACHVRDVFRLYDERLGLMLTRDDPTYPNWDQDVTAVEDRYGEQDPAVVAVELAEAAGRLAAAFDTVEGEAWERTGTRGDGAHFTVETFARYLVHDPVHHLWDVHSDLAGS